MSIVVRLGWNEYKHSWYFSEQIYFNKMENLTLSINFAQIYLLAIYPKFQSVPQSKTA